MAEALDEIDQGDAFVDIELDSTAMEALCSQSEWCRSITEVGADWNISSGSTPLVSSDGFFVVEPSGG